MVECPGYNLHLSTECLWQKSHANTDWFNAHLEEMEPVIEAKRKALVAYKDKSTPETLNALKNSQDKGSKSCTPMCQYLLAKSLLQHTVSC